MTGLEEAVIGALISSMIGAGVNAATSSDMESRSSSPLNNIPKLDQPEDPWQWFRGMTGKK